MTETDKTTERATTEERDRLPTPQIVAGGALVLIGLLWLLERAGWVDIGVTTALAIATILVGLSLMLLARERPHSGLIMFGTILVLITLLTAVAPLRGFQGGIGERVVEVSVVTDLESDYNLAMGTMTIDLSQMDEVGEPSRIRASVALGELVIRVPDGVSLDVRGRAGAGEVVILGSRSGGIGVDETFRSSGFAEGAPGIVLDLAVFLGTVEVTEG